MFNPFDKFSNKNIGGFSVYSSISAVAAAALIDYTDGSNEFIYTLDVSGNNILTNQGTGSTTYDGLPNTGESLEVSAGQEFDIPIHHTLGSEDYSGTMVGGSSITFTDLTGGDWNLEKTDSATNSFNNRFSMQETTGIATGGTVLVSFNASYVSGGPLVLKRAWDGSTYALLDAEYTVVEGANEIEIPSAGVGQPVAFDNPYGTNYDIDFTNISTKEITNPNAYLLMYDTTNTEWIGLGNATDGGSNANMELSLNAELETDLSNIYTENIGTYVWDSGNSGRAYGDGTVVSVLTPKVSPAFNENKNYMVTVSIEGVSDAGIDFNITSRRSDNNNYSSLLETINGDGIHNIVVTGIASNRVIGIHTTEAAAHYINSFSITEILSTSTTYEISAGTYGHIASLSAVPTAADLAILEANIHNMADLWFGRATTLTSIVKADIQHFYIPKVEQGEYLQDLTFPIGSNILASPALDTGWTDNLDGTYTCDGTDSADFQKLNFLTPGKHYKASITTVGTYSAGLQIRLGSPTVTDYTITADGSYEFIFLSEENKDDIRYRCSGVNGFVGTISDVTIEEVDAITIPNYAATMYTNADQNPKGQQTAPIVFDGTGRATNVDYNAMNFNDVAGYTDLGFMPPSDSAWEMDLVIDCVADATLKLNGCHSSAVNPRLWIGQSSANGLYGRIGGTTIGSSTTVVSDGLHHIRVEFDGAGGGKFVVDNTTEYSFSGSTYTHDSAETFFLGATSRLGAFYQWEMTQPTGQFKYYNTTRTSVERTADYNEAMGL